MDLQVTNVKIDENFQHSNFLITAKGILLHIKKNIFFILIISIIAGAIGTTIAFFTPKTFTSKLSFVVEEGKSSGGGLVSLAGQFGIDLSGTGSSSLISGENLLLFLKSSSLAKQTLLTVYDSSKNYSLADAYADVYGLRTKWGKNSQINQMVFFPVLTKKPFTRLQDSLLQVIVNKILLQEFSVERPEKKATFIVVTTEMREEILSKLYCERLVELAIERYINSKTKRQKTNVDKLQKRSDSIAFFLNNKTYSSALEQEKILDVNPASRTTTVNAEVSIRDKAILTTIYGEVVKNLEIAKAQLNQETPTIQVVDEIGLPLRINKASKVKYALIYFFTGGFLITILLSLRFFQKNKSH